MAHLDPVTARLCIGGLPLTVEEVIRHLLACPECREALAPWFDAADTSPAPEDSQEGGAPSDEYAAAFDRLDLRAAAAEYAAQRGQAAPLVPLFLQHPPSRWPALLTAHPEARSPAFADLLLEPAGARSHHDDERRALLALEVLRELAAELPRSTPLLTDLRARAYTLLAEARAAVHDWFEAQTAYEAASRLLSRTLGSCEEATFALSFAGAMREEGRLPDALALLSRAADVYSQHGERLREAAACEQAGTLYLQMGDLQNALGPLARAVLAAEATPGAQHLRATLRHRLAWVLVMDAQYCAAYELLAGASVEEKQDQLLGLLVLLREVERKQGALQALEEQFSAALLRAGEPGHAFETAAAALNLAGLYLRADRLDELPRLCAPLLLASRCCEIAPAAREQLVQVCVAITGGSLVLPQLMEAAHRLALDPAPDDDDPDGEVTHPEPEITH